MRENCVTFFAPVNGILVPGLASYSNQNVNICSGQSYTIGSSSYSTPGTYVDTIVNNLGCDSIVSTTLNVTQPTRSIILFQFVKEILTQSDKVLIIPVVYILMSC